MRKLASIRKIDDVSPIENADLICVYKIGGWGIVDKIGKYVIGDLVVYFEPDSWVPESIAPFLCDPENPCKFEGITGTRLKAKKVRGVVSQGLIMPLDTFELPDVIEGDDVTDILGIKKWEPPVDMSLQGIISGQYPSHLFPKTDSERIQNLAKPLEKWISEGIVWECTMKLHGSSMSVYYHDGSVGVCSRNLSLKLTDDNMANNAFVATAFSTRLVNALKELKLNYAVQGELMGPKICDNLEKFTEYRFYVYDVFDIDKQNYLSPTERMVVFNQLRGMGAAIEHVPVLIEATNLAEHNLNTVADLLEYAEGRSINNALREGVVFKSHGNPRLNFKAVSTKWLLKYNSRF